MQVFAGLPYLLKNTDNYTQFFHQKVELQDLIAKFFIFITPCTDENNTDRTDRNIEGCRVKPQKTMIDRVTRPGYPRANSLTLKYRGIGPPHIQASDGGLAFRILLYIYVCVKSGNHTPQASRLLLLKLAA